ncbi:pilus assembly protein N-terminal domain-containing protein [Bosea sp. (in: a-proteobacteria)]|uniref:pilus assembly protein N-terminal domain-containing protein n=1 Tax=Bosea sp. (in: a-proteobacteria) TaxID=1871050 RepID=UPI00262E84FB|nr:pilus assembly protein N-terminal domain-containing protein [Bosea sp. (in: a-proteobacteria)]MCO5090256.1 pilus assembly protein N-terminal domain-containing protein [Bosea sp. (in: a-proteobacteria)]
MLITRAPAGHRRPALRAAVAALAMTLCGGAFAAPQGAPSESVVVLVDHAKVVRLPEQARTVIVGNPAIADVAIQRNGVMVVTGKSFGVTNLIALDAAGTLLAESLVQVSAASDAVLTVQRGMDRESYACNPVCQPSIQLGDAQRFFGDAGAQSVRRNALATVSGSR